MKILVIDKDPDLAELVNLTLTMKWPDLNIASAPDGGTGILMADTEIPALVILDTCLPDMDGLTVCQEIRHFSDVPIIIVTLRDLESDIVHGLQAGADDYILKPLRHIEFIARVGSVLRRTAVSHHVTYKKPFRYADLVVDFSQGEVFLGGQPVKLTPIEYQLLSYLVKNGEKIVTHRTLSGWIWGLEYLDEINYLRVHINHLREKLEDDASHPRFILTEPTVGYRFANVG